MSQADVCKYFDLRDKTKRIAEEALPMISDDLLRRDVRFLGDMLGQVISDLAGDQAFELVERIRLAARERRAGKPSAEHELTSIIAGLNDVQVRTVARAFSIYFDLANIAEDRQRVRVLREREQELAPEPVGVSNGTLFEL